jgi:hypothetical protein
MTLKAIELTSLSSEGLADAIAWIDWRSEETEIVETIANQLDTPDTLSFSVDGESITVIFNGNEFPIPLTNTGSDRYVMLCSIGEILKDRYVIWLEAETLEGSDTHGVVLVAKEQSQLLMTSHATWMSEHLRELIPGLDRFNNLKIPYFGNEQNNPNFQTEWQKYDQDTKAMVAKLREQRDEKSIKEMTKTSTKAAVKPWWKFW